MSGPHLQVWCQLRATLQRPRAYALHASVQYVWARLQAANKGWTVQHCWQTRTCHPTLLRSCLQCTPGTKPQAAMSPHDHLTAILELWGSLTKDAGTDMPPHMTLTPPQP